MATKFKIVLALTILTILNFGSCSYAPRPAAPAPKPPEGDYRSGFLHFTQQNDIASAEFKALENPIMILSICQLEYHVPFSFQIQRKIQNLKNGNMSLTANANLVVRMSGSSRIGVSLTMAYLVTQPLYNMDYQIVRVTAENPIVYVYSSRPPSKKTYHTLFVLGFENLQDAMNLNSNGVNVTGSDYVEVFVQNIKKDSDSWVQVGVAILDFQRGCEKGNIEFNTQIVVFDNDIVWRNRIDNYRPILFYMVGLSIIYNTRQSSFNYSVETHEIISNSTTHLFYGVIGLNMTCTHVLFKTKLKQQQKLTAIEQNTPKNQNIFEIQNKKVTKSGPKLITQYSLVYSFVLLLVFGELKV